jgi:hypothetical protein
MFPNLHLEEALTILRQLVEVKVPPREQSYEMPEFDRGDFAYR